MTPPALERALREELRLAREDAARAARELRGEVATGLKGQADTLVKTVGELGAGRRPGSRRIARHS